jgi:DNA-binding transcriptional regulator YdaS (Cro superfamily)
MTLSEYLDSQGRGSAAALAKVIGASTSGVCLWRNGVRVVPIERCLAIERATGGKVRAEELRPDHDWSRPGKRRAG